MEVARTETFMFDATGARVDPDNPAALHGEQVQYDADDHVIRRLYLRADPPPVDAVDAAIEAEPGPWDLNLDGEPVTTLADLLRFVGATNTGDPKNLDRVGAVTLLASWPNAPQPLQDEVNTYLAG